MSLVIRIQIQAYAKQDSDNPWMLSKEGITIFQ